MHAVLWIILALGIAATWSFITVRRAQQLFPDVPLPAGEALPTTALQRLARLAFGLTLVPALAAAIVVVYHGVETVWNTDHVRITVTVLNLAALAGFTYYLARVRRWLTTDDGSLDERDRAILAAAPAAQAPAMMVTFGVWMIALIERFQPTHLVPSAFLYAIFWSLLMVSVVALLAGVLIGYRRA